MVRWAVFFFLPICCMTLFAPGQDRAPRPAATDAPEVSRELGNDVEVSIITMGPGPMVYERFGHVGIRLRNAETGFDVLFDWGNFDFDQPNFVGKFVKGSLLYSIQGKPTQRWLDFYQLDLDRTIIEQTLDLDTNQKDRLRELLSKDLEKPDYLYDYYLDNCSTRVRDRLDEALQGQLARQWTSPTANSFRWHTRRLMDVGIDNKAMAVLIDFCCGPKVDQPLSKWESTFIPMELSKLLDEATVTRPDGTTVPLVRERRQLNATSLKENAEPSSPPAMVLRTLAIGLVLGALMLGASRVFRLGYWTLAGLWSAFASFGTIFFAVIISVTRHWVVDWNENFLQFSPVSVGVLLAVLVPGLRKRFSMLPAVALGLSIAGLAITILTPQQNGPALALALPLHTALWMGWKPKARVRQDAPTANGNGKDSSR